MSNSKYRILTEIRRSHREHGYGPTIREIAERMGYAVPGWAYETTRDLRSMEMLSPRGRVKEARTFSLTPKGERALAMEDFRRAVRAGGMILVDDIDVSALPALEVS